MKKINGWIISAIVVSVLCVGLIVLYGYLLAVGNNYYKTEQEGIEAEEISKDRIEIDTALTNAFKEYNLGDFAVSYAAGSAAGVMPGDGGMPVDDPAAAVANSNGYILPDSDKRKLTESDLEKLSPQELTYARNEIYARHGRKFDSVELQQYFDSKDWYVMDERFDDKNLNSLESENAHFISEYQEKNGKTYKAN